jgi:hypothetical protein
MLSVASTFSDKTPEYHQLKYSYINKNKTVNFTKNGILYQDY